MGRGKTWDSHENQALARAWVAASEDPIAGTDQTRKVFTDTMRRRFMERGPSPDTVPAGRYGFRSTVSIRQHFNDLSADCQKFYVALRAVRAANPTGVGEPEICSMAVAIHMGKSKVMDYDYKKFDPCTWISWKAWLVLRNYPKWSSPPSSEDSSGERSNGFVSGIPTHSEEIEGHHAISDGSDSANREALPRTEAPESASNAVTLGERKASSDRYPIGVRGAKVLREEHQRTQAVKTMAESAKRKSDSLEEKVAIAVFSRPEASGLAETKEFFSSLRKIHLARIVKRAKIAAAELPPLEADAESTELPDSAGTAETCPVDIQCPSTQVASASLMCLADSVGPTPSPEVGADGATVVL